MYKSTLRWRACKNYYFIITKQFKKNTLNKKPTECTFSPERERTNTETQDQLGFRSLSSLCPSGAGLLQQGAESSALRKLWSSSTEGSMSGLVLLSPVSLPKSVKVIRIKRARGDV